MTSKPHELPEGLLISWLGDDFTGSAAVMEVLTLAGLPAVLFLDVPDPALLSRFAGYRGMGIAGVSRTKSPQWMREHLPKAFATISNWGAPVAHYKICSTLDSSPDVGSVGLGIEIAERAFPQTPWIPLLPGAPSMGRYQVFGQLFIGNPGNIVRLDRHPSLSRHPITPMTEADVRLHLSHQTETPIGLIDRPTLRSDACMSALYRELARGRKVISLDVLDQRDLVAVGRLIWERRGQGILGVGSQGLEYALIAYWAEVGMIVPPPAPMVKPVDRIAVVSGSCSIATAGQIAWAEAHGFKTIRLDARQAIDDQTWNEAISRASQAALEAIAAGYDPIICTAVGPEDASIAEFNTALETAGADAATVNDAVGRGLGQALDGIMRESGIRRGILAGGDTSGHGIKVFPIQALTLVAPTAPSAGLFKAHSNVPEIDGLELALKGGQMGAIEYFGQIKGGLAA